jgi:KDO2-lipid IV(A) lauroyltransferase
VPLAVLAFRAGFVVARVVPAPLAYGGARVAGWVAPKLMPAARAQVARNLVRVRGPMEAAALRRAVRATFASYARYWVESFRLPGLAPAAVDDGHDVVGYEHVAAALARGRGVILALPHLGGWEWSAYWLTQVQRVPVTAVVEALRPPELFEWFREFRRRLGMTVVPAGPGAWQALAGSLKANHVVCLVADRDLSQKGIPVTLFGEQTTLPAGPATLALRSGAPILPVGVYFRRGGVRGVVLPPLDTTRQGSLRADVDRISTDLAAAFERLIADAPEQWHLLQPNWPSDPGYLGGTEPEPG